MTSDGIASLTVALAAILISLISLVWSCRNKGAESKASFRKQFFEGIIKNDKLLVIAKNVSLLDKTNNISATLSNIHICAAKYLKDIKYMEVIEKKTHKKIHDHIIKIDDSAVVAIQRICNKEKYDDCLEKIKKTSNKAFNCISDFYLGK